MIHGRRARVSTRSGATRSRCLAGRTPVETRAGEHACILDSEHQAGTCLTQRWPPAWGAAWRSTSGRLQKGRCRWKDSRSAWSASAGRAATLRHACGLPLRGEGPVRADRVERAIELCASATAPSGTASGPTSRSTRPSRSAPAGACDVPGAADRGPSMTSWPAEPSAFHAFERAGWESIPEAYQDALGTLTTQAIGPCWTPRASPGRPPARRRHRARLRRRRGRRARRQRHGRRLLAAMLAGAVDTSGDRLPGGRRRGAPLRRSASTPSSSASASCTSLTRTRRSPKRATCAPGRPNGFTVWSRPEQAVSFDIVLRAIQRDGRLTCRCRPGPLPSFQRPGGVPPALTQVGFDRPAVRNGAQVWRLGSLDALFEIMRDGTVRTAGLLRAQTPRHRTHPRRGARGGRLLPASERHRAPHAAALATRSGADRPRRPGHRRRSTSLGAPRPARAVPQDQVERRLRCPAESGEPALWTRAEDAPRRPGLQR